MRSAGIILIGAALVAAAALAPARAAGTAPGASADAPKVRMPVDSVGYAIVPEQVEAVVKASEAVIARDDAGKDALPGSPMIGGICPHDDYIYAGPDYVRLMRNLDVPLVVLVGVSHKARRKGIQGGLVFGSFDAWRGPYGDVPVSGIREELMKALPEDTWMVDDELQAGEHSLEGLIPFIQYYRGGGAETGGGGKAARPGLEILPLLVTRLPGDRFEITVQLFAAALHDALEARGMKLGRDYAVMISADCVHYGDEEWGGRDYAPYGTGEEGYGKAVEEELDIVRSTLTGPILPGNIKGFRDRIDSYEFEWPYKIPWCGVYSIPFGTALLRNLCRLDGREPPNGVMLDYSTSLDPGPLDIEDTGLGGTNIATLRHWVGYAAVGYW